MRILILNNTKDHLSYLLYRRSDHFLSLVVKWRGQKDKKYYWLTYDNFNTCKEIYNFLKDIVKEEIGK